MKDNQGRRLGEGRIETENKRGNENRGDGGSGSFGSGSKIDKVTKDTKDSVNRVFK